MSKIGFIGCGQMAQALAKGFTKASLYEPKQIALCDVFQPSLDSMTPLGFITTMTCKEIVEWAEIVIIAVKPKDVKKLLKVEILPVWKNEKLLVSICAGIPLELFCTILGSTVKAIRVMPNYCCLVGESASCFCGSPEVTKEDGETASKMFNAVGRCYEVEESYLNTVTGLSGSGPAFIFILIDAMADAGVKGGLSREVARGLAVQTVLGSAKVVLETGLHPCALKDQIASPGGTTIAGIAELERTGFRHSIISAVDVARLKSEELSEKERLND